MAPPIETNGYADAPDPNVDVAEQMTRLDAQINVLNVVLQHMLKERQQLSELARAPSVKQVKSQRQSRSTVVDLPVEILSQIFWEYLEENPMKQSRLMLVSRVWYTIVEHSPHLWTKIAIYDNPTLSYINRTTPLLRKFVSKSGDCTLDINVDFTSMQRPAQEYIEAAMECFALQDTHYDHRIVRMPQKYILYDNFAQWISEDPSLDDIYNTIRTQKAQNFFALIVEAIGRCRELSIDASLEAWEALDLTFPKTSNRLEKLRLTVVDDAGGDVFFWELPQSLVDLSFSGCYFPTSYKLYSNNLRNISLHSCYPSSNVIHLLQCSPNLASLRLCAVEVSSTLANTILSLPVLHDLHLEGSTVDLLSHISSFSVLQRLSIRGSWDDISPSIAFTSLKGIRSLVLHVLSGGDELGRMFGLLPITAETLGTALELQELHVFTPYRTSILEQVERMKKKDSGLPQLQYVVCTRTDRKDGAPLSEDRPFPWAWLRAG